MLTQFNQKQILYQQKQTEIYKKISKIRQIIEQPKENLIIMSEIFSISFEMKLTYVETIGLTHKLSKLSLRFELNIFHLSRMVLYGCLRFQAHLGVFSMH